MAETHRSENARVVRAAGVVGIATMLSRVFGLIRDTIVAGFFGAGLMTDAFFVAFRIPNLLRRLLAEGSLTVSFVPVFTEYLRNKTREEALELADIAFTALSILLVVVSLAGVLFSPLIVTVMAPGFVKTPAQYDLAVFLTRLMFPYIFLISLVALCMGILNSLRHFAAPALSPVVLNIAMILAALTLRDCFQEPIVALAVGVMAGGVLQLAMQWPFLIRMGVRLKPNFRFRHPGVKRIGLLMLPAAFGAAIYQINIFIGTILASLLPTGSVSYLYYADRIVELPLGVFAIAVGTATLPSFSEQVALGKMEEWKRTIAFSLRLILFITVPGDGRHYRAAGPDHLRPLPAGRVRRPGDAAHGAGPALLCRGPLGLLHDPDHRLGLLLPPGHQSPDEGGDRLSARECRVQRRPHVPAAARRAGAGHLHRLGGERGDALDHSETAGRNDPGRRFLPLPGENPPRLTHHGGVILLIGLLYPWQTAASFPVRLTYLLLCVGGGTVAYFTTAFLLKSPEIIIALQSLHRRLFAADKA